MGTEILFIGNYTDDKTYDMITKKGIRDLSQAARLFQKRLINSLAEHAENFSAISVLPTDNRLVLPERISDTKTEIDIIQVSNGSLRSIFLAMRRISGLIKRHNKETRVIMYAVNPIALIPLLRMRKKYRLTLVTICPELPQFRRYKKTIINNIKRNVFKYFNTRFDKYIVFANAMREYLPKGKPCILLEGFAPEVIQIHQKRKKNIAMYAGGLAEDNGIMMMIEAAHLSKYIDELWICGVGDCLEYVRENTDEKVRYLGRLTNEEVLMYENQAKVLLNVRNPENELTKFSFPSKVLEYMAAGGVVITSKLPGIPEEYYSYMISIDEYTPEALSSSLDMVFSWDDEELLKRSRDAISFIKMKSANQRCKEIIDFVTQ